MKNLLITLSLINLSSYAQLTSDSVKKILSEYRIGSSTYFEPFIEKKSYGAPWILTSDGGAALFGSNTIYKFDKKGKEIWTRIVQQQYGEMESQGVVEDNKGNLFVFMLSYNPKGYRGGAERVLCYDKKGKLLWDKTLGAYTLMNNPTVSYIRSLEDGRIYLRGHVVKEKPIEGKDPSYRYWEGWINSLGKFTQQAGDVIDWKTGEWQKKFKPE